MSDQRFGLGGSGEERRWIWVNAGVFQYVILIDWMWELKGREQSRMTRRSGDQAIGYIGGLFTEMGIMGRCRYDGERRSKIKSSDLDTLNLRCLSDFKPGSQG